LEDAPRLLPVLLDGYQDLVKWLGRSPKIPTLSEVEEEIRTSIRQFESGEFIRFVVERKSDGLLLGRMGFPPAQSDWRVPHFGISYALAKSASGQGYATEGANALTRYAFEVMGARRVQIKVDTDNVASGRIPQKLGFELEATQRGIWPRPDKEELATIQTYCVFDLAKLPALSVVW